ncbi:glycine zipper 2TM domain-containing protein [Glacieibacterium frigidum]|uniref:17 kDa surface antigen n=2 Tax=Glacieibacterium frigidum TaxID=2593303 RepID=A0A552UJ76_9SPHN|nr:glycine zipper 2TM domain-containing protein [Glacieibacterium frigidum]
MGEPELHLSWRFGRLARSNQGYRIMNKLFLTAGLLASLSVPAIATAQVTCEQARTNRTVGTVAGAGIGAVLGSVIAGRGDKTEGAIIGGLVGGIGGNQVSKSRQGCENAYGFYDRQGNWRASNVPASAATGYYDREGQWVDGAPRGAYDSQGRWVASNVDASRAGYRDSNGHWVPASANGYYDSSNRYQQGVSAGYWDNGRWVAGRTSGSYDSRGRWIPGRSSARQDAQGNWVYDPQPGYYDNGRWIAGTTRGYYDTRGTWISVDGYAGNTGYGNDRGNDRGNYAGNDRGNDGPRDVRSRIERLDERISRGETDRTLTRREAANARAELASITRYDRSLRNRRGDLSPRNEALVSQRLDRLRDTLREARQDARSGY